MDEEGTWESTFQEDLRGYLVQWMVERVGPSLELLCLEGAVPISKYDLSRLKHLSIEVVFEFRVPPFSWSELLRATAVAPVLETMHLGAYYFQDESAHIGDLDLRCLPCLRRCSLKNVITGSVHLPASCAVKLEVPPQAGTRR